MSSDGQTIEGGAAAPAKKRRLPSLDYLRGLTVIGMILVNATDVLHIMRRPVFEVLLHAPWAGFTVADAVFPAFIMMVGVSLAVSAKPDAGVDVAKILWRSARLFLVGLLLANLFTLLSPEPGPLRLLGVLQRIGIVYAVCAFIYPYTSLRTRAWIAGIILAGYWIVCMLPAPDGVPTDLWVQGHNIVSWFDRAVLGAGAYVQGPDGYDPEGLLSTLPAIAQGLLGTIAGDFLRRQLPIATLARGFALAGVAAIVAGLAWGFVYPISKPLWTGSFVLLSGGITLVGLAAFHALYDGRPAGPRGGALGSFGRNAIAAYVAHYLALGFLGLPLFQVPVAQLTPVIGAQCAALAPVAIFFVLLWVPLAIMDRLGWHLRI